MTGHSWNVTNAETVQYFCEFVMQGVAMGKSMRYSIEADTEDAIRTEQQRKALEVWCRMVAKGLNDAGLGMKAVLAVKEIDAEWTQITVKEVLFKPLLAAMTYKDSTTKANTTDYDAVRLTLGRHLSEKLGFTPPPWPDARGGA